jgi:hypothetical protein
MRYAHFFGIVLLLTSCSGRKISVDLARDLITETPPQILEKEDVDVVKVMHIGSTEAIAETRLKTAFRLEKVKDEWVIREVRLGHGQWEKVNNLSHALEIVRIEETQKMLERISEATMKYRESNGKLPLFKDYVSLSDQLSPKYLTPLIRLDSWRQPLGAESLDANRIRIWSAGPDGKGGTSDDIQKIIAP